MSFLSLPVYEFEEKSKKDFQDEGIEEREEIENTYDTEDDKIIINISFETIDFQIKSPSLVINIGWFGPRNVEGPQVNPSYFHWNELIFERSVDMDTNLMDTGVHVHVTDMDTRFLKNRDMDVDMDTRFLKTVTRTWTWKRTFR